MVIDVRDFLETRPTIAGAPARIAYVAIRYTDGGASDAAKSPHSCDCGCSCRREEESGRISDGFTLGVLWGAIPDREPFFSLCQPAVAPCPTPRNFPWVLLAAIRVTG